MQVPLWLNRARAQHGVFSSVEDLPAIQVSTDHQCIVWCNQVVTHTATTLLKLASGAQLDRLQPKSRYTAVLQRRYPPLPEPAPAMGFPSRRAIAVWAVVSLPKLPALCAASVAAFASEVCYVTDCDARKRADRRCSQSERFSTTPSVQQVSAPLFRAVLVAGELLLRRSFSGMH